MPRNGVLFVSETFAILILQEIRSSLYHVYRSSYSCTAKDGINQHLYLINVVSLNLILFFKDHGSAEKGKLRLEFRFVYGYWLSDVACR